MLDVANAKEVASGVKEDMQLILNTIQDNAELTGFLNSPVVKNEVKYNALNEIFSEVGSDVKSLFKLLYENNRFEILKDISAKYSELYDELKGIQVAYVTTAVPLNDSLKEKVLAKVKELTPKKVSVENIVNPEIIGGFIIKIGDKQYNASVENKLQQLKREFIK